jgi:hypothetical protein
MPPRRQGARRKAQGGQGKQGIQASDDEQSLPSAGEDVSKPISLTDSPVQEQLESTDTTNKKSVELYRFFGRFSTDFSYILPNFR